MKKILLFLLFVPTLLAAQGNLLDLDYPYRNSKGVIDYRFYKVNETKTPYSSRQDVMNTVPASECAKGRAFMVKNGSDTSEYIFYHGTAYANLVKVDSLYKSGATIYTSDGTIISSTKSRTITYADTGNVVFTNPSAGISGLVFGSNLLDPIMIRKWTTGGITNGGPSLYVRNNGGMVAQASNSGNSIYMGDNISIGNNTYQNFYNIIGDNAVEQENSRYRSYFGNNSYTEGNLTFAAFAKQSNGFFNASFAQTPYWYNSFGSLLLGNNPIDSLCYGCIVASTPKTTALSLKDTLSSVRVVGKGSVIYGAINLSGNTNVRSNKYNAVSSNYSGALLGINHNIPSNTPNSAILGGNTINVSAGDSNTVYLPKVKIGKGLNASISSNDTSRYLTTYNYDGSIGKTLRSSLSGGSSSSLDSIGIIASKQSANAFISNYQTQVTGCTVSLTTGSDTAKFSKPCSAMNTSKTGLMYWYQFNTKIGAYYYTTFLSSFAPDSSYAIMLGCIRMDSAAKYNDAASSPATSTAHWYKASGTYNFSIYNALANGTSAFALGTNSYTEDFGLAYGGQSYATYGVALGTETNANNGVAIGTYAGANYGVAIGNNVKTKTSGSVTNIAIGWGGGLGKEVLADATGNGSINISAVTSAATAGIGSHASQGVILGGVNNNITTAGTGSIIIGGSSNSVSTAGTILLGQSSVTSTVANTLYTPLNINIKDAGGVVLGTTTGTKFGTATNQKIGFFNTTPVVQPTGETITTLKNLGLVSSAGYTDVINGVSHRGLGTGALWNTTSTGVPSINTVLTSLGNLTNASGYLTNNGSGTLTYTSTIPITAGGTGATSASTALTNLGAQQQLNGTGFVKATGTTISYDNSAYLTKTSTESHYTFSQTPNVDTLYVITKGNYKIGVTASSSGTNYNMFIKYLGALVSPAADMINVGLSVNGIFSNYSFSANTSHKSFNIGDFSGSSSSYFTILVSETNSIQNASGWGLITNGGSLYGTSFNINN